MTTNQIYTIVNSIAAQSLGSTAIAAVDTQGLVALGTTVLSSSTNTEAFLDTLAQRIGKTIIDFRRYRNRLADMVMDDFEYGAILQKIKVHMPDAESDESYGLTDGVAVDHYVVAKPVVTQKLFVTRTPYQFKITIQREHLKEAFESAEQMGGFIAAVFGEVQNAVELALENLGKTCLNNFIAETSNVVNLVTEFNTQTGSTLTAATAPFDKDFMAYAIARINETFDTMQAMSEMYNDGSVARFTPKEDMRVKILSKFNRMAQTVVQYAAFHEELISIDNAFEVMPFWQDPITPAQIIVKRASDGTSTTVSNIIAVVHDRDALGMYRKDEVISTTPLNAAGLYYNQYWHEKQLWFNDLSENFVYFTLN